MGGTIRNALRGQNRTLAAIGFAAAVGIAGCGSGDDTPIPDGGATPTDDTTLPTVDVPEDGFAPTVGTEIGFYPVYSFSFPVLAKGFADAGGYQQEYPLGVVTELKGCTIGNLGALNSFEPSTDLAVIADSVAALATVVGSFRMTADQTAGDIFSFSRLGDVGTENWSAYFFGPDERWSGSGQEAVVEAKFFPWYWVNSLNGQQQGFPILGIRVRWTGEATENLSSRKSSAIVEFECYFLPTGDWLLESGLGDFNDNGILDDDEAEAIRTNVYLSAMNEVGGWMKW